MANRPRREGAGNNSRFDDYDTTGGPGRDQTGPDRPDRDRRVIEPTLAQVQLLFDHDRVGQNQFDLVQVLQSYHSRQILNYYQHLLDEDD